MRNEARSSAIGPAALTVVEAWRYPVKSMGGEKVLEAEVGPNGVHLDRGWAVRDENLALSGARGTSQGCFSVQRVTCPAQAQV